MGKKHLLVIGVFLFAFGCESSGVSGVEFKDFRNSVAKHAGADAVDCGLAPQNGPYEDVNTCALENFAAGKAFFAIYQHQGTDSFVSSAVVYTQAGEMYLYFFDSDPGGGGRKDNGVISYARCQGPKQANPLDLTSSEPLFECDTIINL